MDKWKKEMIYLVTYVPQYSKYNGSTFIKFYKDSVLHNEGFPAKVQIDPNGRIRHMEYYLEGTQKRPDGPCDIEYDSFFNLNKLIYSYQDYQPTPEECMDSKNLKGAKEIEYHNGKLFRKIYNHKKTNKYNPLPYMTEFYGNGKLLSIEFDFDHFRNVPDNWTFTTASYYPDGKFMITQFKINGLLFNPPPRNGIYLPSEICYYNDGSKTSETFCYKGSIHNKIYGPAHILYNPDGSIIKKQYYSHGRKICSSKI